VDFRKWRYSIPNRVHGQRKKWRNEPKVFGRFVWIPWERPEVQKNGGTNGIDGSDPTARKSVG
jgi:hypothetical protein